MTITIDSVKKLTPKALIGIVAEREVILPLTLIEESKELEPGEGPVELTVPQWLAEDRELDFTEA